MSDKKNLPLIIGLSIPFIMTLLVALSIYVPGLFSPQPKTNFIYSICDGYYSTREYYVEANRIEKKDLPEADTKRQNYSAQHICVPRLYLHDVIANQSRDLTFDQAQQLRLDPNATSPDGFEVTHAYRSYSPKYL